MQGDIIESCPIFFPSSSVHINDVEVRTKVTYYDVIKMTQSCDLEQKKADTVLVCPFYSLSQAEEMFPVLKSTENKNAIREGVIPAFHLLNKCELKDFNKGYLIVNFRDVYGIPYNLLQELAVENEKRLRLLSPYREHLSQAFARFFMRVGLPIGIPKFKSKKSKT